MKRGVGELAEREFDLVVVGGGIFGICVAWDAALRGLSVAILERDDFGGGASANCFKLVHGGIRYLQHADVARTRLSCRERNTLMRLAPHQISPLPMVLPTYGHGRRGREILLAGMRAFDLLSWDRNRGVHEATRRLPRGRLLSRGEVLATFPFVEREGLNGGGVVHEAQMHDPARLALSFLHSAVEAGAVAANYVEATGVRRRGDRVDGVEAHDRVGGSPLEVRGRLVIVAAGGWSPDFLRRALRLAAAPAPTFSRDVCLVLRRPPSSPAALAFTDRSRDADALLSRDGRHLILAPWRGRTLLGVWHRVVDDGSRAAPPDPTEIRQYLAETNRALPGLELEEGDVALHQWGPVLFASARTDRNELSFGKRSLLVDHAAGDRIEGLITLVGVRYTTCRYEAERTVDLALRKLGRPILRSRTAETPIFGGAMEDVEAYRRQALRRRPDGIAEDTVSALVQRYGSEHARVVGAALDEVGRSGQATDAAVADAEVAFAVREEMACRLDDVVFRRTDLGTGGHPGTEALQSAARRMAALLGWDGERTHREIEAVEARFAAGVEPAPSVDRESERRA